jgi:hypothetical protein
MSVLGLIGHVTNAAALIGLVCLAPVDVAAQGRGRDARQDPVPRVESLSDILPKTADEQRRAQYFDLPGFAKLLDQPPGTAGIVSPEAPHMAPPPPGTPPPTAEQLQQQQRERFRRAICALDAIAIGTPGSRRVLLNKSGTWLFTDLQVSVDRWIVPGTLTTRTATFSFSGGAVNVAGRVLSADSGRGRGPRLGETSVFFLQVIDGTASHSITAFEQMAATIREPESGLTFTREEFPNLVATAAATCTSQDRRQR